ncbi:MAG: deoxynucleotide monophosphate kinase [Pseudomonadota bacterium]
MKYPPVIALAGPAGAGKSTAAAYLVREHGYTLVKFAAGLKAMLRLIGLTDAHIEGHLKEVPCKLLCGRTPRHAMQTLGSEWGRDLIGADLWANVWLDTAADVLDQGGRVVVDDCRFENEAAKVRELGGIVVRLDGRAGGAGGAHPSEAGLLVVDCTLENVGSVKDLEERLGGALNLGRFCIRSGDPK